MNITSIITILPRPFRDIVDGYRKANAKRTLLVDEEMERQRELGHKLLTGAITRISLLALGTFAMLNSNAVVTTLGVHGAILLGSVISLPTMALAGGSYLLYQATAMIVASYATASLATFGIGAATAAAGWLTLELHDSFTIGIVDMYFLAAKPKQPQVVVQPNWDEF